MLIATFTCTYQVFAKRNFKKHFNKVANGTAANHYQADIKLKVSYIRNVNITITSFLEALIRKYFDIVKMFDEGRAVYNAIVNVTVTDKNIITITTSG